MTMHEIAMLLVAALVGAVLGGVFFGGLWWTVRAIVASTNGVLLQLASLVGRTAIVLVGFHLASAGELRRLLACTAGFVTARILVARWVRRQPENQP